MSAVKVTCTEPLLSDSADSLLRSCKKLLSLYQRAAANDDAGDATFELTCDSIDPGAVLLLMNVAFRTGRLGWRVQAYGAGHAWDDLLLHINHYLTPKEERTSLDDEGNYLLRDLETRGEMVVELDEWSRTVQRDSSASDEDVAIWQFQISEVATNSFQHAQSSDAMLIAGKVDQKQQTVQLAALDFGATIPATICKHRDCPQGDGLDGTKVRFACRQGVTAKTERTNQGAGLHNLVETVKKNGGTMRVLSGNGLFHIQNGRRCSRNLAPFSNTCPVLDGTLVSVNLKI